MINLFFGYFLYVACWEKKIDHPGRKGLRCSDWKAMICKWNPGKKEGIDFLSNLVCYAAWLVFSVLFTKSYKPTEPYGSVGRAWDSVSITFRGKSSEEVICRNFSCSVLIMVQSICANYLSFVSVFQGRHVKTGQLAAIKVMDVTEVRLGHRCFQRNP